MDKQGNHKQSLSEHLADPELEAILEADPGLREALEAERLSFTTNSGVIARA